MKKNKGFTIIELLIVILIVSILSVLSIPLLKGSMKEAVMTEAIMVLGAIRTIEKMYYVEHGAYMSTAYLGNLGPIRTVSENAWAMAPPGNGNGNGDANITKLPGISPGDFDGTYFSEGCYDVQLTAEGFDAICWLDPALNQAPKAADTQRLLGSTGRIQMDQYGTVEVLTY